MFFEFQAELAKTNGPGEVSRELSTVVALLVVVALEVVFRHTNKRAKHSCDMLPRLRSRRPAELLSTGATWNVLVLP